MKQKKTFSVCVCVRDQLEVETIQSQTEHYKAAL